MSKHDTLPQHSLRERLTCAVAASGSVRPPSERPRPDNGPTPDRAYAREVVAMADAILVELTRTGGSAMTLHRVPVDIALADAAELLGDLADQDVCPGCGEDGENDIDHTEDCPIIATLAQLAPHLEKGGQP